MDFKERTSVYCVEEFLNRGPGSLIQHVTNASSGKDHKREPIKDLIVSGIDSSEGKDQMGAITHLFMRPKDGPNSISL